MRSPREWSTGLPSLRKRIEALLFVASEPAGVEALCDATGASPEQVRAALAELSASLSDCGFVLREVAGGWKLASHPSCRDDVERFLLPPKTHLSAAALETLAIVAYLQPVTRAEIESLRGVNCDGVVATLEQRRLIRELGRKDVVGRPILYGTTAEFLEALGLRSIDELPALPQGGPYRLDNVIMLPRKDDRTAEREQIHEAVEGHEDEVVARREAKLERSVAVELQSLDAS